MQEKYETKESVSCGAIVWRKNRDMYEILLIKQFLQKESWGIPKGHINEDESFEQCARREVREETGIDVVLAQALPEVTTTWGNEKKRVISYMAQQVGSSDPHCNDPDCEVAEVRWFSVDNLPRIHPYQRSLVEHAIKTMKGE